jgi:type IV pilus assembly protein PilN
MIRINLLGQERPKTTGPSIPLESSLRLILFFVSLALAVVVLFVIYQQKSRDLAIIEQKISSAQAEKARLQEVKAEVLKFEQDKTVLQQRIDVIEALQASRSGGQQLLQMVANTVSRTDELWLTSLDRKGNSLEIAGESASINSIANFITQMRRSGYFDKIEIKDATENDIVKGAQTFGFHMTADVSQVKQATGTAAPAPARPGKS